MAWLDTAATMRAALLAQFGEIVTYESGSGPPLELRAIFQPRHVLVRGDAAAGVEALAPAVFLALASLPVDPELDDPTIVVKGERHRVIERMPDGAGGVVLFLRLIA